MVLARKQIYEYADNYMFGVFVSLLHHFYEKKKQEKKFQGKFPILY